VKKERRGKEKRQEQTIGISVEKNSRKNNASLPLISVKEKKLMK
jgi:hypothetical protein